MGEAFTGGSPRILNQDGIGSVVFAHKTTEGWEALLSGMIQGVAGPSPAHGPLPLKWLQVDSEVAWIQPHLATSVHLICRPRPAKTRR